MDLSRVDTWGGLSSLARSPSDVTICGIPFDGGVGGRAGAAHGPRHLRYLSKRMKTVSWRGHDFSDLALRDAGDLVVPRIDLPKAVESIRTHYHSLWGHAGTLVTIGGDHSVTFPILQAGCARGGRWGVIWLDAHPDLLDSYLGSPISHGSPLRRIITDAGVRSEDVLLLGTRAYDAEERSFMRSAEIAEISAAACHADWPLALARARMIAAAIATRVDHLYVSIDVDVLDPAFAPGTGTPVGAGLSTAQLMLLLEALPSQVRGYDIVEYAPPLDVVDITGQALLVVLSQVFAQLSRARVSPTAIKT